MNTPVLAAQPQNMAINLFDPAQFETMQRICKMYVNSDLVPESYRVTDKRSESKAVANCMIAVSMAQRMNADHMMSCRISISYKAVRHGPQNFSSLRSTHAGDSPR